MNDAHPADTASTSSAEPAAGPGRQPDALGQRSDSPEIEFDVTVVDGEAGRRLGVLQSQVILDVLTWLHEHHRSNRSAD